MIDVKPFLDKLNKLQEYMDDVIDDMVMIENMKLDYKYKLDTNIHLLGQGKPSFEIWVKNKYGNGVDYTLN